MCSKYIVRSEMEIKRNELTNPKFLSTLIFVIKYIESKACIRGAVKFDKQSGKLNILIEHAEADVNVVQQLNKHFHEFSPYVLVFARMFWRWNIWDGVVYIGEKADWLEREDKLNPVKLGLLKSGLSRDEVIDIMRYEKAMKHRKINVQMKEQPPLDNEAGKNIAQAKVPFLLPHELAQAI